MGYPPIGGRDNSKVTRFEARRAAAQGPDRPYLAAIFRACLLRCRCSRRPLHFQVPLDLRRATLRADFPRLPNGVAPSESREYCSCSELDSAPKQRNPRKTVLFLGKHRVTPCRKQRCAPFPARLEPRRATRGPALLTEPGVAMGLGAGAGSGRKPPRTTKSPALRPNGSMSFATHAPRRTLSPSGSGARLDAGRWTGQVHRPRRRVTTLIGMPGYTVPVPKPRPTRTDPGPEGHVRRESREV
jgi:hypothetical protein